MSDAYTDRLLDLAYGELPKREAREVEAHAASCDACRAELARIRGTRQVMAALPEEPAPDRGLRLSMPAQRSYTTFSKASKSAPGRYQVVVRTQTNEVIARAVFEVVASAPAVP